MATEIMRAKLTHNDSVVPKLPSMTGAVMFSIKATAHQLKKGLDNRGQVRRYSIARAMERHSVIAQSRTPLFSNSSQAEAALVAGKVQNLRVALAMLNGVEIPANDTFSFWAQIGRPSASRGFVEGRELREGCLIPTIGGGLCQLSNALYSCALQAGLRIIERHAHSAVVPGSFAEYGQDATVFWNYVDLRFASDQPFRIEAKLTRDELIVTFKGSPGASAVETFQIISRVKDGSSPASCASCGQTSCFRNASATRTMPRSGRTAYVVDECWPEYNQYVSSRKRPDDAIGVPLTPRLVNRPNYGWDATGFGTVRSATTATLRRSLALRTIKDEPGARPRLLLKYDELIAASLASLLTFDVSHVVVSQNLLPFLWRDGCLGGRTFDVLMTRLPVTVMQRRLDKILRLHPESKTAGEFRAEDWFVAAENEALAAANGLVTPNSEIAGLFPERAVRIPWQLPFGSKSNVPGGRILFPAAALARKGAYEVRDAASSLGISLTVAGPNLEDADFWRGVRTRRPKEDMLDEVGLVLLPAYIEDKPRVLLRALARGIPVIASEACGLAGLPGVTVLPEIETGVLIDVIRSYTQARSRCA